MAKAIGRCKSVNAGKKKPKGYHGPSGSGTRVTVSGDTRGTVDSGIRVIVP